MDNFTDTKWVVKSKTFLGLAVVTAAQFAPVFGLSFNADDGNAIVSAFDQIITAAGILLALYGRFEAKTGVSILPK